MTGTFIGELLTPGGENVQTYFSPDPRDMWAPVKRRVWTVPGCELRSRQAATIPLRPAHGMAPIGNITALQRRPDGAIWAAGTIDSDVRVPSDRPTYLSVEAQFDPGGGDVTVHGAAVCERSATVALRQTRFLRSGVDQFGAASWRLASWQRELLERASRYRPHGEPIVVEGASATAQEHNATRSDSGGGLELRSADVVDVCRPMREAVLLVAPAEVPAVIHERGRTFTETFSHGCFAGAEREPGRVKLNRAHQRENTFGKAVSIDPWSELGCVATFRISKVAAGDEALTLLADGLVVPSVGFGVPRDGEEWRDSTSRRIRRGILDHVALTSDAAHRTAVLALRGQAL